MAEGKAKYDIFCTVCHGAAGDGNGVTKPYGVLAASYHDDRLRSVEDGYIFDVIKNGKGLMLPLNDRISQKKVGRLSFMFEPCNAHKTQTLMSFPLHNAQS